MATSQPVVVCTYGPSGIGKTVDQGFSFPRALFVAAPGALYPIESVCGYTPDQDNTIDTIYKASDLLKKVKGKYQAIVFDDFSFLSERTAAEIEKKHKNFAFWNELRDVALDFRDQARFAGIHVVINCWENPPKTDKNGAKVRGGPQLSGKLPEQIPALCDVVLRAQYEPKRKPWPAAYRCSLDPSYVMKDRLNIATLCDPAPMNLGEILRAAGITIDRLEAFPRQEDRVQAISEGLTGDAKADAALVNDAYAALLKAGVSVSEARWTLRDALDRSVIRRLTTQAHSMFIDVLTPTAL